MDDTFEKTYTLKQVFDRKTGALKEEQFYNAEGQLDRDGQPAAIAYDIKTGLVQGHSYYKNGKCHREDGPATYAVYVQTGIRQGETWWLNGKMHRSDGKPAITEWDWEGRPVRYAFYENDKKTRKDLHHEHPEI